MKFFISIILIAFLSSVTEFFLPWWTLAIVAFIISFVINLSPGRSFLAGFLGIFIFWLPDILKNDFSNEHVLSQKMALLFGLPNYAIFILVSALIGSMVGGFASLSGALFRKREHQAN